MSSLRARVTALWQRRDNSDGTWARRAAFAIPLAVALGVAVYAFLELWYLELTPTLDDIGLFNPIYMLLHTGHLSYPIYPVADSDKIAYVHPPGDPIIVAFVMWLTSWPAMAAGAATILLFLFLDLVVISTARWSAAAKIAFIGGLYVGIVLWAFPTYIRPDLRLAGAWIGGLVALESARLAGWSLGRLVLGAFLIALVPTLHYPGSGAVFTIAIYAIWVVRDLGFERARRALVALGVGAAIVLVPYAALFIVPWWHDILTYVRQTNTNSPGILGAIRMHREIYHVIGQRRLGGSLLYDLALPFTKWGIPVVLVTTPVFYLRRETRGIALGSLPLLLFLLLFTHTKGAGNIDYYLPEFILYYAAVTYVALLAVGAAVRLVVRHVPTAPALAAGLVGAAVIALYASSGPPTYSAIGIGGNHHATRAEMELARAVTEPTLPPNALLLNNPSLGLWYITGATRVYPFWRDLAYAPDYSSYNLRAYLAGFTAIAAGEAATFDTFAVYNKQRLGVSSWYASGLLKPYRFYWGDTRTRGIYWGDTRTLGLRFVLLSEQRHRVEGSVLRDGRTMEHYVESPGGPFVLASVVCPVTATIVTAFPGVLQATMFLPGPSPANVDPYVDAAAGVHRLAVQTFLASRTTWETHWRPLAASEGCAVRDLVPLRIAWRKSPSQVLAGWHDREVLFPSYVAAANQLYAPAVPTSPVGAPVDLSQLSVHGTLRRIGHGVDVAGPSQLYAEMAQMPIAVPKNGRSWLAVRGSLKHGKIDLCLLTNDGCAIRRTLAGGATGTFYMPVPAAAVRQNGGLAFYVQNEQPGNSEVEIDSVRVVRASGG